MRASSPKVLRPVSAARTRARHYYDSSQTEARTVAQREECEPVGHAPNEVADDEERQAPQRFPRGPPAETAGRGICKLRLPHPFSLSRTVHRRCAGFLEATVSGHRQTVPWRSTRGASVVGVAGIGALAGDRAHVKPTAAEVAMVISPIEVLDLRARDPVDFS